jgi:hypothetical protein
MNDDEIEEMIRDAINLSLQEENRTVALAWFDRQMAVLQAMRKLGLYPDELGDDDSETPTGESNSED